MSDDQRTTNGGPEPDLKTVRTAQGEVEALALRAALEAAGIPCLLKSDAAGRLYGITVDGLGAVKVMVRAEHLEEARVILETTAEPLDGQPDFE